jgi:hypothetical protein
VKSDGTFSNRISDTKYLGSTDVLSPVAINKAGQIAYVCKPDSFSLSEICLINADGTGYVRLTKNSATDAAPWINNVGQVVYVCQTRSASGVVNNICIVNTDGTDAQNLTQNAFNELRPMINDNGYVIFLCPNQSNLLSLCSLNIENQNVIHLVHPSVLKIRHYSINSNDTIVFGCDGTSQLQYLCISQADGSSTEKITEIADTNLNSFNQPHINNLDRITTSCVENGDPDESNIYEICISDLNGAILSIIRGETFMGSTPMINDAGIISYYCEQMKALCSIREDGTDRRKLFEMSPIRPGQIAIPITISR